MRTFLITLFFVSCLVGCEPTGETGYGSNHAKYLKQGEQLVYCSSEVNIPQELLYHTSKQVINKMDVPELAEPFTSYYITDVLGDVYAINSDEMNNYKCFEVVQR